MKLEYTPIVIERSQDFEEETFGISDVTVVMEILRSKLYSNPIKVLVQEYMSNARDAHRELGKDNVPIEVTLPTEMHPQFEVRDFGPGITPSRMKDVFIKYAASTKRDSNNQTGGFGLGSKSGWSYSDIFNVITITNENGPNVMRTYSCVIDETRCGKLIKLCDDVITDEPCGTKIIVPARKENFAQFRKFAIQTGSFWTIRPTIHGETFTTIKSITGGANWKYFDTATLPEEFCLDRSFVVYDGIPYPLKIDTLVDSIPSNAIKVLNHACFGLYFGIGEISISANREEIHYTEKTRKILANRVCEMIDEIASKFSVTLEKEETFVDALIKFNEICEDNTTISRLLCYAVEWNGIKMDNVTHFTSKQGAIKIQNFFYEGGTLKRINQSTVNISKENLKKIYVNDEPLRAAPTAKLESMFYKSADRENFDVYVISFQTNNPKGLSVTEIDTANKSIQEWKTKNFFNHIELPKISSIQKGAYTRTASAKAPGKIVKYRELSVTQNGCYPNVIEHEDYDNTLSGYYVINDNGFWLFGSHINMRDKYDLRNMQKKLSIVLKHLKVDKILVFTPKYLPLIAKNPNLRKLENSIADDIVNTLDINKLKEHSDYMKHNNDRHEFISHFNVDKYMTRLTAKNGFKKIVESFVKQKTYSNTPEYHEMSLMFSEFGQAIEKVHKLKVVHESNDDFSNKYPLLANFSRYHLNHNENAEVFMDHAIQYINLIDITKV